MGAIGMRTCRVEYKVLHIRVRGKLLILYLSFIFCCAAPRSRPSASGPGSGTRIRTIGCGQLGAGQLGAGKFGAGQLGADNWVRTTGCCDNWVPFFLFIFFLILELFWSLFGAGEEILEPLTKELIPIRNFIYSTEQVFVIRHFFQINVILVNFWRVNLKKTSIINLRIIVFLTQICSFLTQICSFLTQISKNFQIFYISKKFEKYRPHIGLRPRPRPRLRLWLRLRLRPRLRLRLRP